MPIQQENIRFVESQVMDDVPEGGGAATGRVIVDGLMNNVFEDISDLDRAYGRFNLRKIFVAIRTLDTDLFGGAKTVITDLPEDSAIGYALFATPDPFDTRAAAADRVEAYLFKGPTYAGYLHENHIIGMRAINVLQRVGTALPPIGKTLCLVQSEGLGGEVEQYVRVIGVSVTDSTFTDTQGDFARWRVRLDISDALRYNFNGHEANRLDSAYNYTNKTRLRDTQVADATRYYGSQYLTEAAGVGDLTARVSSIFAPLVPSAQAETPLVNQSMNPELAITLDAGTRTVEFVNAAHTLARTVTAENRRLNWVETLVPIPAQNGCSIAFRAQGNWYVLVDNGAGVLEAGDPTIGVGTLNYETGALAVTLGALPDVGSQIMFAWGSPVHAAQRTGAGVDAGTTLDLEYTLQNTPVVPTSVSLSYPVNGTARTVTDPDGNGALSGTGVTGTINYATGDIRLRFATPPDRAGLITNAYIFREGVSLVSTSGDLPVVGGTFTVPGVSPFRNEGAMVFTLSNGMAIDGYITAAGDVRVASYGRIRRNAKYLYWADQKVGTFQASTGVVTITNSVAFSSRGWSQGSMWSGLSYGFTVVSARDVRVTRDTEAFDPSLVEGEQVNPSQIGLTIDMLTTVGDRLIPNSLRFTATGKTYDDRSGALYTDIDPITGSGLPAGSVDYETGVCTINLWADNQPVSRSVTSCLTLYGDWTATTASFRAALSPLKPESLQVTATTPAGVQISGTADADGVISTGQMLGSVNYEFGTATVDFGAMADDPDYVGPAPIPQVWVPLEVLPSTIRYNAVSFSYIPLDADILGIDPVRLPPDGRVPIYRKGDVVLVMHTAETDAATVTNGQTISCGRTRIGWIRVLDATGQSVIEGFELDRASGVVTFLDVSGVAMPVKVRHTVADLRMVSDVQITGHLTFSRALSHDYPPGDAVIGSCLIHGDRRARVSAVWDQQTWTGVWSDRIIGSEAIATLDTIAHPIVVTNEGAETERWILRWTSTTNVELIGQRRGLVFSGPFNADIAPINPRTRNPDGTGGVPYMSIPLAANGGGWSTGNVVRINTVGAIAPIWMARAIQQSDEPMDDGADGCEIYCLGNIDRP